jgi:hypothetical protein
MRLDLEDKRNENRKGRCGKKSYKRKDSSSGFANKNK